MDENSIARLQVKELKRRFESYNTVTVDDFYDFYKEIYGEIKRSTVRWYLYELKNNKVIRNVSRGVYSFTDSSISSIQEYVVITMDIIQSSDIEYREFNNILKRKVEKLNNIIDEQYEYQSEYNVSQGDEVQIMCPFDRRISSLFLITLAYLHPLKVRYGISIGEYNGDILRNSWEMNGPIFWNARDSLLDFKESKGYDGAIVSEHTVANRICSNLLKVINILVNRISDKQWDAIKYELSGYDFQDSIYELNISKTSYYDRISTSNMNQILDSLRAIFEIMEFRGKLD